MELIERLYAIYARSYAISTDSRNVSPGAVFFGLQGGNIDGSRFAEMAIQNGAAAAVVSRGSVKETENIIEVDDPLEVLQQLAGYHRDQLKIPIIGITGSNGKTTTKELLTRVLAQRYMTGSTKGNLNNHIGVPMTLLSFTPDITLGIVEMGANHVGEIAFLCQLCRPTHGVITNIGKAHLEGFGGLEGVKRAKSELFDYLGVTGGIAFVNGDELFLTDLSSHVRNRLFYASRESQYADTGYEFRVSAEGHKTVICFEDKQGTEWEAESTLFGGFNVANIITAIAIGKYFDVAGDRICDAIASYVPQNNRAQRMELASNVFIMDAYNANPTSMTNAIRSFAEMQHPSRILILGAMMELGEYAIQEHEEVAEFAGQVPDARIMLVGDQFESIASKLGYEWFRSVADLNKKLAADVPRNSLILVKGSRAMGLEGVLTVFQ